MTEEKKNPCWGHVSVPNVTSLHAVHNPLVAFVEKQTMHGAWGGYAAGKEMAMRFTAKCHAHWVDRL